MKAEKSVDLIARLEQKTDEHITLAIHTFQNLSNAVLLRPSAQGGWSIAQCLEHLNRYDHFYLPQVQKAMQANTNRIPEEFFKSGWLGNYFINTMDGSRGKTYKAFKDYVPPEELDPHRVVAEFIQQKEMLLTHLRQATNINLSTIRVPISIAPFVRLKLGDVFQFLIMHNERHVLQAKRNLLP